MNDLTEKDALGGCIVSACVGFCAGMAIAGALLAWLS